MKLEFFYILDVPQHGELGARDLALVNRRDTFSQPKRSEAADRRKSRRRYFCGGHLYYVSL
jgi:hypothetical protein